MLSVPLDHPPGIRGLPAPSRALLLALATLFGCAEDATEPEIPVADVEIRAPATVLVNLDESIQLQAVARSADGAELSGVTIAWSVRDTSYATIDSAGTLFGRAVGQTFAFAAAAERKDSVRVTVTAVIEQIIMPDSVLVGAGRSLTLAAQAVDTAGREIAEFRFRWSSSDVSIATVDSLGRITTVRPGVVEIVARADAAIGRTRIRVEPAYSRIYVSWQFSCALADDGAPYCWGNNNHGQLGTGDREASTIPRRVAGDHRFRALALGQGHVCGLTTASEVLCWGSNNLGALGTGDLEPRLIPTPIAQSGTFADVSSGEDHSCAIDPNGQASCWGDNIFGVLGIGTAERFTATTPRPVAGETRFRQLVSGAWQNTCGLSTANEVFCWGRAGNFPYAAGSVTCDTVTCFAPTRVLGAPQFSSIAGSYRDLWCGLTSSGEPYCWGYRVPSPAALHPDLRFASLGSGLAIQMCGVTKEARGYCWSGVESPPAPVLVGGDLMLASLVGGYLPGNTHSASACGISVYGVAYCWRGDLAVTAPEVLARPQ